MKFLFAICLLLLTASFAVAEPTVTRNREKGLFEFRDGDRVVFLGSAFIERLQNTGYLETMLTAAIPSKNITFRNLGWSGDTVWGDARAPLRQPGGRLQAAPQRRGPLQTDRPHRLLRRK